MTRTAMAQMDKYEVFSDIIVNQTVRVRPGEKVLISLSDVDDGLAEALIRAVYQRNGLPFYEQRRSDLHNAWLSGADEAVMKAQASWDVRRMEDMDVYIGLHVSVNPFDASDIPQNKGALYRTFYETPVHFQTRLPKTRWLSMGLPGAAAAQAAGMSTKAYEDFYYKVCCLDYEAFGRRMEPLSKRMAEAVEVRLTGENVDLRFTKEGIGTCVCRGTRNIPAGEVFTSPSLHSATGWIEYNVPTFFDNGYFEGVRLELKDGRIVSYSCRQGDQDHLDRIFAMDEGARFIGEFAMGTNPFIDRITKSVLFDEKAWGSFHFTPGNAYKTCGNGNESRIHWDMVYHMQKEFGGGEVIFDNEVIQRDGVFIPEDLQPLNPERLREEISVL